MPTNGCIMARVYVSKAAAPGKPSTHLQRSRCWDVGLSAKGLPWTSSNTSPTTLSAPAAPAPSLEYPASWGSESTTRAKTLVRFGWLMAQLMAISSAVDPSGLTSARKILMATGLFSYSPTQQKQQQTKLLTKVGSVTEFIYNRTCQQQGLQFAQLQST